MGIGIQSCRCLKKNDEEKTEFKPKITNNNNIEENLNINQNIESLSNDTLRKKEEIDNKKEEEQKPQTNEIKKEEEEHNEDLNKLNDSDLKKKKAEMDVEFEKNNIKKGDANFQYDIRKEFDHEQYAAEWDDESI